MASPVRGDEDRLAEPPRATPPAQDGAAARRAARAASSAADSLTEDGESPQADPEAAGLLPLSLARIQRSLVQLSGSLLPLAHPGSSSTEGGVGRGPGPLAGWRRWITEQQMSVRSSAVDEFGFDPVVAERWRPLLEFLYRSYWRVEPSGMENIPDRDAAIIVANHAGTFPYDGAMVMAAVKYDHPAHREVRPLIEDFLVHFPFVGAALCRIGYVRACPENGARLLRHGQVVAVFPEGVKGMSKLYRDRYKLQRFGRGGFVKLALQCQTRIIPTAIIGSEETHPLVGRLSWVAKYLGIPYLPVTPTFPWLGPLGTLPLPTKWQIRFGEPLDFASQYGPEAACDRVLINRLTEQVRSTIQSMVDEALLRRRSVVLG